MYKHVIKRLIDIVVSFIGAIVTLPFFLIIAIIIFIDDPGPVFFKQKRVGKNKKLFSMHKFRSMKVKTPDIPTHLLENPEQYITKVGRFLRKTSLDELPQIYDILRGKMSIVGPRPALWNQDDLVAERDKYQANDVKPGLTGWAQINGRDELSIAEKSRLDGEYVAKLNAGKFKGIAIDTRCFFGTFLSVLRFDGVVEGSTKERNQEVKEEINETRGAEMGKKMNISFSPPDVGENEIEEIANALRSGWITTGSRTKKLEKLIADYVGTERCVCLNSQTACAEMALRILEIGEGDEVITSAYTYTASASIIDHVGAKIVFVDTQKDSLEMDYDSIESKITENTKAIIPIDIGGVPCDYDRLFEIVERKKAIFKPKGQIQEAIGRIAIMADTAHSFGSSRKGQMTGSIADFSAFSFHAVKNFTTAEGGALTWRNIKGISSNDIYKQLQLLSLHGQNKDALAKTQLGAWEYDIVGTWYKCNMTDIAAAMGLAQFKRYPDMLKRRKEIIEKYDTALKPLGIKVLSHYTDTHESSGHLYITRIPNITSEDRNVIIAEMAKAGIACNVHYKPLPMHTAYKNLGYNISDFPNAYDYFSNEITLPLHTCLTDEEVEYIIKKYTKILKSYI